MQPVLLGMLNSHDVLMCTDRSKTNMSYAKFSKDTNITLVSKVKVKCHENLITSMVYHSTYLYSDLFMSISDK